MTLEVEVPLPKIINLISKMSLSEIEEIKNEIIKRELFFKKFQKDDIENIVDDFKHEGYSAEFLKDLENGLRNSSIYKDEK